MELERTKEYMKERRESVLDLIENFTAARSQIVDTEGIEEQMIHVGGSTMTLLVFGHKGDKRESNTTLDFTKSMLLLEGSAKVTFSDGTILILSEEKKEYANIPHNLPYVSEALENDTVVVVKLRRPKLR